MKKTKGTLSANGKPIGRPKKKPRKGWKMSEESRRKVSEALKRRHAALGHKMKDDFPQRVEKAVQKLNGIELLTIESGVKPRKMIWIDNDPAFQKLRELLPKLQIGQSIPIKKEWQRWPRKVLRDDGLAIKINIYTIPDNPKFVRVFRTQ